MLCLQIDNEDTGVKRSESKAERITHAVVINDDIFLERVRVERWVPVNLYGASLSHYSVVIQPTAWPLTWIKDKAMIERNLEGRVVVDTRQKDRTSTDRGIEETF